MRECMTGLITNRRKTLGKSRPFCYNLSAMIPRNTVLILGAGASYPYGFPLGSELINLVSDQDAIRGFEKDDKWSEEILAEWAPFRTAIQDAQPPSVDDFLEERSEHEKIGRLCIAGVLMPHESRAKPQMFEAGQVDRHWYRKLWHCLSASFEEFQENKLSLVTFNYDRSLEHYLFTALKSRFNRTDLQCAEKLAGKVIHVYGQLGYLPWQDGEANRAVPFGDTSPNKIKRAAEGIQIMHTAEDTSPEFERARKVIADAKRVLFLGFGFHDTNIRRLGFTPPYDGISDPHGTCVGLPRREQIIAASMGIKPLQRNSLSGKLWPALGNPKAWAEGSPDILDLLTYCVDLTEGS